MNTCLLFLSFVVYVCTCFADAYKHEVCENNKEKITCPLNMQLVIEKANYGRTNKKTCRKPEGDNSAMCSNNVKKQVAQMCNDKTFCTVTATNGNFGDKCVGVTKYLEVVYGCKRTVTVCEGSSSTVKCNKNGKIQITKVMYGRSNKKECRKSTGDNNTISCLAERSKLKLKKVCDGLNSCILEASNTVYGDPCPGTNKFLEVEYICS